MSDFDGKMFATRKEQIAAQRRRERRRQKCINALWMLAAVALIAVAVILAYSVAKG